MPKITMDDINGPDLLDQALAREGINSETLAKKLKEELEANELSVFVDAKGANRYRKKVAWSIRQRARMDAHKLMGHYPADKHELTGKDGGPIKLSLSERLKEISQESNDKPS